MKFKALAAIAIFSMVTVTGIHAFGLGAQLNLSAGRIFAPGAAVAVSPSDNFHLAFNWYLERDNTNIIGLTLDGIPLVIPISTFKAGSFNFNLGIGGYANLVFEKKKPNFDGGLRVPIGVNLLLGKDVFEIYTHVAPSFGISLLPRLYFSRPFFPIALGARFWFR